MRMIELGSVISPAKVKRCGTEDYPVLSMTMHEGLVFQSDKFKKEIASKDKSAYKVVLRNQLVISFPIDEGVLATQRIVDTGIVSPAYGIWDIDQTKIDPEYLEYALRCNRALEYYRAKLRGSTARRRSLPTPTLLEFSIPLISLNEQKSSLDILHRVKDIIALRKEQLTALDTLIKSRFVEMFEAKYPMISLGSEIKTTSGGTPSKKKEEYYFGGDIPWLTSGEVNLGFINSTQKFITQQGLDNSSAKWVPANSVVIAMYGATAGKVGVLKIPATTNQAVCVLLPNPEFETLYLYCACTYNEKWMLSKCVGVAQPNISQAIIKEMPISKPPIAIQKQFAAFVAQVEQSKAAVQQALDEAQMLFDSLMQQYFG